MRLAFLWRMTTINSFRDLTVWQVSMDLAGVCFDIVEAIQHPYRFTFTNQGHTRGYLDSLEHSGGKSAAHKGVSQPSLVLPRVTRRTRNTLRAHPSSEAGTGSALEQGVLLIEPIGKMLHGLAQSLEARLNAQHPHG